VYAYLSQLTAVTSAPHSTAPTTPTATATTTLLTCAASSAPVTPPAAAAATSQATNRVGIQAPQQAAMPRERSHPTMGMFSVFLSCRPHTHRLRPFTLTCLGTRSPTTHANDAIHAYTTAVHTEAKTMTTTPTNSPPAHPLGNGHRTCWRLLRGLGQVIAPVVSYFR